MFVALYNMISINFYILHEVSMEKIEHIKNLQILL